MSEIVVQTKLIMVNIVGIKIILTFLDRYCADVLKTAIPNLK